LRKKEVRKMKELESLIIVRHGVSTYNHSKTARELDPEYIAFRAAYDKGFQLPECVSLAKTLRMRLREGHHESETPLLADLHSHAVETGRGLSQQDVPDLIIVSPYRRTRQTLEQMTIGDPRLAEVPLVIDERIREREHGVMPDYGDKRIFFVNHPEQRVLFEAGEYDYRYPGGENIEDVKIRVSDWLRDMREQHAGKRILAVTHHETILVKRMVLEGLGKEDFLRIDRDNKPKNCGVTTYQNRGNGLDLVSYNQVYY
jgi:2,3-bisphosphoglycerate-dependent phosphoglycerate mutase